MHAMSRHRKETNRRAVLLASALACALSACSGTAEPPNQLAAHEPEAGARGERLAPTSVDPAKRMPKGAPGVTTSPNGAASGAGASPAGASPAKGMAATGPGRPAEAGALRCAQLRQDGVVWERARKLAVLNRGEAGARMADLNTPWTKENVSFYLASCQSRKQGAALPAPSAGRPFG